VSNALAHGAATDVGGRNMNQDFFVAEPPLFAVADGMGGHRAGDVASRTAVEVVVQQLGAGDEPLTEAVREANREVFQKAGSNPDFKDMGTTMTAMLVRDGSTHLVHVGDSRAYLLRAGELRRLTEDHSLVARMVREGRITPAQAEYHPQRSVLEKALGIGSDIDVDATTLDTEPGDRILLCSDGLTNVLDDQDILRILQEERDPTKAAKRLVTDAVRGGANDNVTSVVVDFPGEPRAAGAAPAPEKKRRGRRRFMLALVLALLLIAAFSARAVVSSPWWVGEQNGRVTIFKGVSGSYAGMRFVRVQERTDIGVESLPESTQSDLREGIPAESRADARSIVSNLRKLEAPATTTPPQPPSTPPGP
jgi:serine/threonine protein phosphatase PrpC